MAIAVKHNGVTYSDRNSSSVNSTFSISNGEIEVRNSALTGAVDGLKRSRSISDFRNKYGGGLSGVIYAL